jgi:MscS family membrane protein
MSDGLRDFGVSTRHDAIAARAARWSTRHAVRSTSRMRVAAVCLLAVVASIDGQAQSPPAPAPAPPAAEQERDSLGRSTPRGTVLGFLDAAHAGDYALASRYLESPGRDADQLAQQLFVVLDARLPARLSKLSNAAEGSRANPLTPDQDVIGAIESSAGRIDIVVTRVANAKTAPIWLFSQATLAAVPELYAEVTQSDDESAVTRFLTTTRLRGIRLFDWLIALLGAAGFYLAIALLNRSLTALLARRRKRIESGLPVRNVLPLPARLLIVAVAGRWALSNFLPLSLLVRQFWSSVANFVTIVTVVWLLILLNGQVEQYIRWRKPSANSGAAASLLRVLRRVADVLVIFIGVLATFKLFGIDPTPALAGLGVGGIAFALAAQKTLENIIAGASLVFDQAVRVGDSLKMGEIVGTVDHIGLRSTRIRTLDRTVVIIPNSQIANAVLETLSARDKFWFHPVVSLRYETTPEQVNDVVEGVRRLLAEHPSADPESVRVQFIRLGSFSLDVEVTAYLFARDWGHFLELQERLLLGINAIVSQAGTRLALPSQTMYTAPVPAHVAPDEDSMPAR